MEYSVFSVRSWNGIVGIYDSQFGGVFKRVHVETQQEQNTAKSLQTESSRFITHSSHTIKKYQEIIYKQYIVTDYPHL
jgi:hypothetical protein